MKRAIISTSAILALSACASTGSSGPVPVQRSTTLNPQGLEAVLGATQGQLTAMFGEPRLTIPEPPALKLQFVGTACILDAYLYPPERGGTARVTHVDARNSSGAAVDRAACVSALRR